MVGWPRGDAALLAIAAGLVALLPASVFPWKDATGLVPATVWFQDELLLVVPLVLLALAATIWTARALVVVGLLGSLVTASGLVFLVGRLLTGEQLSIGSFFAVLGGALLVVGTVGLQRTGTDVSRH